MLCFRLTTGSYSTAETVVNQISLCHKKPTDQNDFYTEKKAKKQAFQRCLWKRIRCLFRRDMAFWILYILGTLSKNRHGNLAVSSFVGFSIEENIHENVSTRTLLAKASKLNMYIHNIHFFSIKLISPVIAVYKLTVFPISLNCPTIPYKNLGGYHWKKIDKNIHNSRLLCCNLYLTTRGVLCPKFLAISPGHNTNPEPRTVR